MQIKIELYFLRNMVFLVIIKIIMTFKNIRLARDFVPLVK